MTVPLRLTSPLRKLACCSSKIDGKLFELGDDITLNKNQRHTIDVMVDRLAIRSGILRFRIAGMDQTEYAVGCLFLGDPAARPSGGTATFPRKLLQPFQLLDHLRFAAVKDPAIGTLYGEMVVEKK